MNKSVYHNVDRKLKVMGLKRKDLAELMGEPASTISDKLNGKIPLRLDEAFRIVRIIGEPNEGLDQYFPMS